MSEPSSPDADRDAIDTAYLQASGDGFYDCAFLAQRYLRRRGYRDAEAEMWVLNLGGRPGVTPTFSMHHPTDSQYSGLWRSPSGVVYVSDASLRCVRSVAALGPEPATTWTQVALDMAPYGVWGLDDTFVVAWGVCGHGAGAALTYPMARFDGRSWSPMADPGFEVYAMHGVGPDALCAVGALGQVATFDGSAWRRLPTPVDQTLTGVFMVTPDEVYVTGDQGALLEGGAGGYGVIAQAPGNGSFPLLAVAWWQGALWVAGGVLGVLRRVGRTDVLEVVKPNVPATALDARRDLLVTTREFIAGTADGVAWSAVARNALADAVGSKPLRYYR